ncbi:InlB B-repeat-containing protein [uncultured Catenibacterium sp.]|uniref:InlB B-repeat-containing protein n=1 Tax=uncultured Catenibacterium sp. TaxID=286142 RepID=UPI0025D6F7F2|nr:InlB B-repeat-containing protein [uncultured Catenibacterium sp.]
MNNFKKTLRIISMLLIAIMIGMSGMISASAATITNNGQYSLILYSDPDGWNPNFEGEYSKMVKFNVEEGETTVKVSELTKGITPFNGENEFSHWETMQGEKVDELNISDFTHVGSFYTSSGEEVSYSKGLILNAKFKGKPLNESGNYYVTLDAFGGILNGKAEVLLQSKKEEFKTIDLTKYTPIRKGYTFVGWDLNGEFVTSVDASAFTNNSVARITATYKSNTFSNEGITLTLNGNGGMIEGKEANTYDYVGGGNSGTSMSLLPYIPVRDGYTFNGWNTKKDGSGSNVKYIYWRNWDNNEETNKEFDKDTLIDGGKGYSRYKNITLYASWTKNPDLVPEPVETVKKLESTKGTIEFEEGINKNYKLDIKKIEVNKDLASKNVKFVADINVLDGDTVVKITDTKMKIRLLLPEDLKGYDKYEVVYILDDEIKETIPAVVEDGYITFETTHLSQYGIIATKSDNKPVITPGGNNNTTGITNQNKKTDNVVQDTPKTGDNTNLVLTIGVLVISAFVLMSLKKRRA